MEYSDGSAPSTSIKRELIAETPGEGSGVKVAMLGAPQMLSTTSSTATPEPTKESESRILSDSEEEEEDCEEEEMESSGSMGLDDSSEAIGKARVYTPREKDLNKPRNYACEYCSKRFLSDYTCAKHSVVCGVPCQFCGAKFMSVNGFKAHLYRRHGKTEWKNYIPLEVRARSKDRANSNAYQPTEKPPSTEELTGWVDTTTEADSTPRITAIEGVTPTASKVRRFACLLCNARFDEEYK